MPSPPRTCPACGGSGHIWFPCYKPLPPGGDCLPPLAYGVGSRASLHFHRRKTLLLQGCDEGWNQLHRKVDKKIIDGQRLFSILHSSHKRHDVHVLFARLFLLGQGCPCCVCNLTPVLIVVGTAPGDKGEEAVLPEEGVRIERWLLLGYEGAQFVSLLGKCKGLPGVQQMLHRCGASPQFGHGWFLLGYSKGSAMECAFCHPPPGNVRTNRLTCLLEMHNLAMGHSRGRSLYSCSEGSAVPFVSASAAVPKANWSACSACMACPKGKYSSVRNWG